MASINLEAQNNTIYLESLLKNTMSYKNVIHTNYTNTAISIDNYITNDYSDVNTKIMSDKNYIFIKSSLLRSSKDKIKYENKIRFKLYLPKFRKKYDLVFESDDDLKTNESINKNDENIEYDLALNKRNKLLSGLEFNKKIGIKIRNKLNPFLQISLLKKGNIFNLDYLLSQELKESYINKLELNSLVQVTKKINNTNKFTNSNRYYWNSRYKKENNISNLFSIQTKYSNKNSLSYNILFNSDNKDSNFKLKRYSFFLDFKHKIKEWLYLNITPENYYSSESSFKPKYLFGLSLSLKIGKK